MSYEIRLFGEINRCLDAVIGNTSPLGELSPYSRTFSTDKTKIALPEYEEVSATVFSCRRDGVDAPMPAEVDLRILGTLETLAEEFTHTLDFQSQLTSLLPNVAATADWHTLIVFKSMALPGYISWTERVNGDDITFHVWLADSTFRSGYDLYEIRVVPPLPNLMDLQSNEALIREALDDYTIAQQISAQEEARGEDSVTRTVAVTLKWVDPDTGAVLNLTWLLLVFGPQGLLYENQLGAIRDFLRDETGVLLDVWVELIPEIDRSTTLTLLPLWHQVALHSSGSTDYVHSPVIDYHAFSEVLRRVTGDDPELDWVARTAYAITYYKSIGFMVYTEESSSDPKSFRSLYPDYAMISLNDINLNRLAANTREAVKAIERGIRMAETYSGETLPEGFYRQVDGPLTFICYSVNGVTHRIATRPSFLAAPV